MTTTPSAGLSATFQKLAETANEAALPLLVAALDATERGIQNQAFRALLARGGDLAAGAVIGRWNTLSCHWRSEAAERPEWLHSAVREALVGKDEFAHRRACAAAIAGRDYDLAQSLISFVEKRETPFGERSAATLVNLLERLSEEIAAPRDYRNRRDPLLARAHILGCLERAVGSARPEGLRELLEALAIIAPRDNPALLQILQNPGDRGFAPLCELLVHSPRRAIRRLLLGFLDDPFAPLSALQCAARRRDLAFFRGFCRRVGPEPPPAVKYNLKRLEALPALDGRLDLLAALNNTEQQGALQIALLAGVPRPQTFDVLVQLLKVGAPSARRAAAVALATFRGPEANAAAVDASRDPDPAVRAAVLPQLRERAIPGTLNRLVELLESKLAVERNAARECLAEFVFAKFLAAYDMLDDDNRLVHGQLVRKVDPSHLAGLQEELEAPSRSRRRRALEMTVFLGAAQALETTIAALLQDEDQYIRLEAVRVLADCHTPLSRAALAEAACDHSALVKEAAAAALAEQGAEPVAAALAAAAPLS